MRGGARYRYEYAYAYDVVFIIYGAVVDTRIVATTVV